MSGYKGIPEKLLDAVERIEALLRKPIVEQTKIKMDPKAADWKPNPEYAVKAPMVNIGGCFMTPQEIESALKQHVEHNVTLKSEIARLKDLLTNRDRAIAEAKKHLS